MLAMIEALQEQELPKDVIDKATQLIEKIDNNLKCGDSDLVCGYWIETHTLGCRNESGTPEDQWFDEHETIYEEYCNDGKSIVIGAPDDTLFLTIT